MLPKFQRATKLTLALASGTMIVVLTIIGWTIELSLRFVGITLFGTAVIHLSAYGIIVMIRFFAQIYFARKNNAWIRLIVRTPLVDAVNELYQVDARHLLKFKGDYESFRQRMMRLDPRIAANWPAVGRYSLKYLHYQYSVGVEMPVFGLDVAEVEDSVNSLLNMSYPLDWIVVVLNDPTNHKLQADLHELMQRMPPHVKLLESPEAHKRAAMAMGYRFLINDGENLLLNIDGDTVVDVDGLLNGMRLYDHDPSIVGQTSNVKIRNRGLNLLTEITYQRYWQANNVERAAQSWFRAVTCMSGPFMLIDKSVVQEILSIPQAWEFQTFRGFRVGPGDDRRMTTECLKRGYGVCYNPDIIVWTDCPEDMPRFLRQQLRWSRSAYREFFDSFTWMWGMPLWCIQDQIYLALFPLLLLGIIGSVITGFFMTSVTAGVITGAVSIAPYVAVVVFINLARTAYAVACNRDWRFWLSFSYLFIHIRYLMGIKFNALITLTESKWLGRKGV